MAFLIKYWADTTNKVRKDICFMEACFFQMKPRSLLFRAYLGIMQSPYNSENLLFWEVQWNISGPICCQNESFLKKG